MSCYALAHDCLLAASHRFCLRVIDSARPCRWAAFISLANKAGNGSNAAYFRRSQVAGELGRVRVCIRSIGRINVWRLGRAGTWDGRGALWGASVGGHVPRTTESNKTSLG